MAQHLPKESLIFDGHTEWCTKLEIAFAARAVVVEGVKINPLMVWMFYVKAPQANSWRRWGRHSDVPCNL